MNISKELLTLIDSLKIKLFLIKGDRKIIAEIYDQTIDSYALSYPLEINMKDGRYSLNEIFPYNQYHPLVISHENIILQSDACIAMKKDYFDILMLNRIGSDDIEDFEFPESNYPDLEPKGYWDMLHDRLKP